MILRHSYCNSIETYNACFNNFIIVTTSTELILYAIKCYQRGSTVTTTLLGIWLLYTMYYETWPN